MNEAGEAFSVAREQHYQVEYEAFAHFLRDEPIPIQHMAKLGFKSLGALFEGFLRYVPGAIGFKLRYYYYRMFLKKIGKNVLIDVGVFLNGPANISLSDYVWIDVGCILNAYLGDISVGRRVHIAPNSILGARAPIVLEDYVGLSAGVRIYANTEAPIDGKRMSGPMIPEDMKAFQSGPVTLRKDSFVGTNGVILPGVEIGEGAVVGANSVISKSVAPWAIVVGPGKLVRYRDKVTVPDI
jgi:acetyltransferase-like isoleucine patch superfamily enzyme